MECALKVLNLVPCLKTGKFGLNLLTKGVHAKAGRNAVPMGAGGSGDGVILR